MRDYNGNEETKPIAIYVWHDMGLGDNMFLTPIIRKLHNIYNEKITLFSPTYGLESFREFFKNNPYVEKVIRVHDKENENSWDELIAKYDKYIVFNDNWSDYYYCDLRQLVATKIGFTLKEEEMDLDYYPDPYIKINELPEKYVCINPYISGVDRNWEKQKWQDLVDKLNYDGIYVVAIGKGQEGVKFHNLDIRLGANLCNRQNNLSQTWHIINMSDAFVTFDCSMYVLAGTTNTHIIQIGWYGDPFYHMPIRKGIRGYKYDNVNGNCDVYCLTDPQFDVKICGSIRQRHVVQKCMLDRDWICKPSPDKVYGVVKKRWKNNENSI